MQTFIVTIDINSAVRMVHDTVVGGSITGTLVDQYTIPADETHYVTVITFDKHYYRAGNRLTLTVTLDNMLGRTRIHACSAGGGEGLFRFDWGASDSFEGIIYKAFTPYITG